MTSCCTIPSCTFPAAAAVAAAALAASLAACSLPTPAVGATVDALRPMRLADVQVVDRSTGERLPIHGHAGSRWVAGTPGHRYAIDVRNRTGVRLLAVIAVDGVNVVSGETAGWSQRGYVFGPGESYEVAGWRKTPQQIAAFEFASLPDSYAARTGRPENVGVIGVAFFREAQRPVPARDESTPPSPPVSVPRSEVAPAAASGAAPSSKARGEGDVASDAPAQRAADRSRLGTAHGTIETSYAAVTSFERASATPDEVISIRYDRRENLVALGVLAPEAPAPAPTAFPASASNYVPDPPAR
ncbi:MAG TPA: hypothetical protein VMU33_16660 [Burkholderiaceae bacterium]|nr:hypothetical protein [Burkholderiaceae bacterium]